ncbi:MAG: hypothetical protein P4L40_08485, partial [Terracidiphilus sp.]|nr:hypothetical protein [Terracidiphilus sp.]
MLFTGHRSVLGALVRCWGDIKPIIICGLIICGNYGDTRQLRRERLAVGGCIPLAFALLADGCAPAA